MLKSEQLLSTINCLETNGRQVIVAMHGNKPIPIGTLKSIIDGSGLSIDVFSLRNGGSQMSDLQESIRQFNEEEAIWRCFEQTRKQRSALALGLKSRTALLDYLDWIEAEQECREIRGIGKLIA